MRNLFLFALMDAAVCNNRCATLSVTAVTSFPPRAVQPNCAYDDHTLERTGFLNCLPMHPVWAYGSHRSRPGPGGQRTLTSCDDGRCSNRRWSGRRPAVGNRALDDRLLELGKGRACCVLLIRAAPTGTARRAAQGIRRIAQAVTPVNFRFLASNFSVTVFKFMYELFPIPCTAERPAGPGLLLLALKKKFVNFFSGDLALTVF